MALPPAGRRGGEDGSRPRRRSGDRSSLARGLEARAFERRLRSDDRLAVASARTRPPRHQLSRCAATPQGALARPVPLAVAPAALAPRPHAAVDSAATTTRSTVRQGLARARRRRRRRRRAPVARAGRHQANSIAAALDHKDVVVWFARWRSRRVRWAPPMMAAARWARRTDQELSSRSSSSSTTTRPARSPSAEPRAATFARSRGARLRRRARARRARPAKAAGGASTHGPAPRPQREPSAGEPRSVDERRVADSPTAGVAARVHLATAQAERLRAEAALNGRARQRQDRRGRAQRRGLAPSGVAAADPRLPPRVTLLRLARAPSPSSISAPPLDARAAARRGARARRSATTWACASRRGRSDWASRPASARVGVSARVELEVGAPPTRRTEGARQRQGGGGRARLVDPAQSATSPRRRRRGGGADARPTLARSCGRSWRRSTPRRWRRCTRRRVARRARRRRGGAGRRARAPTLSDAAAARDGEEEALRARARWRVS